jgi:hypothetical protein
MRIPLSLIFVLLLAACESTGAKDNSVDDGIDPNSEQDALEQQAYDVTGDVRVFYYVKDMMLESAFQKGEMIQQEELRNTLLNKGHSFYRGVPDHQIKKEERFLHNSDMYDLLKIFKELGFFAKGHSVNIFADDPIARADSESGTTRVIAVEVIKDGKVNTSYFARRIGENLMDDSKSDEEIRRAKAFNECQAVFMQAIAGSLPRGAAGYGDGDTSGIDNERR